MTALVAVASKHGARAETGQLGSLEEIIGASDGDFGDWEEVRASARKIARVAMPEAPRWGAPR